MKNEWFIILVIFLFFAMGLWDFVMKMGGFSTRKLFIDFHTIIWHMLNLRLNSK